MPSPDDARTVAYNPAAPEAERTDALAELTRQHRAPASDMTFLIEAAQEAMQGQVLAKARSVSPVGMEHSQRPARERGMHSVRLDKEQLMLNGDWFDKPGPIGFEAMRTMVDRTPILSSIVLTRVRQVQTFCQISEDGGAGFEIRHCDRAHELTDEEKHASGMLAKFFANCGWETSPRARKKMERDSFSQFMAKSVKDSLVMDSAPIEVEFKRNRALGIDAFYAVDGSTIRLCTEDGYEGDDKIVAVQVVNGQPRTAYTWDSLVYEVRNPRTDVRLAGYGYAETELLIQTVTGILNTMAMNIAGLSDNSIPKGVLHLVGKYGPDELVSFKRYWKQSVTGADKRFALPMMVSEDADSKVSFEKFGVDFDEMMFSKWITFLTATACAVYGISPDEIGFEGFSAGTKSNLAGDSMEEKLANSKDLGLHPLLDYYESVFSDFIVSEFDPKYCFRWVGRRPEDKAQEWEAKKLLLTVDELRAEKGYDPYPDAKVGALPLNPALLSAALQLNQAPAPGQDFGGQGDAEEQPDYGQPDQDQPEDGADGDQGEETGGGSDAPPTEDGAGPGGAPAAGGGEFGGGANGDFGKALTIYAVGG